MGILCNCLVGVLPYTYYAISSPLRGAKVLHCAQYDLTRRKNEDEKRAVLWCSTVAHMVKGRV